MDRFEIFAIALPGLEPLLTQEVKALGFGPITPLAGGVSFQGNWYDLWRANLELRGATRVLMRLGDFMAFHLAQLDKRASKFPWAEVLDPAFPLKVEVTSKASKIYHAGAAAERIEGALTKAGFRLSKDATISLKARIERNKVTLSLDSSGESLHKRGHKQGVGKAPLRETMAAMFLRDVGFDGSQAVLDPMCGSGTFIIEAAEIAAGLQPGRSRRFAFEQFAGFDAEAFAALRRPVGPLAGPPRFFGSDRDAGAVSMATDNAARAGVSAFCQFTHAPFSDIAPPPGPPGLVMVNPPYGARIGNKKLLFGLYGALGQTLKERFSGWRVGLVTSEPGLARACGLDWAANGPVVPHGGLKIRLYKATLS